VQKNRERKKKRFTDSKRKRKADKRQERKERNGEMKEVAAVGDGAAVAHGEAAGKGGGSSGDVVQRFDDISATKWMTEVAALHGTNDVSVLEGETESQSVEQWVGEGTVNNNNVTIVRASCRDMSIEDADGSEGTEGAEGVFIGTGSKAVGVAWGSMSSGNHIIKCGMASGQQTARNSMVSAHHAKISDDGAAAPQVLVNGNKVVAGKFVMPTTSSSLLAGSTAPMMTEGLQPLLGSQIGRDLAHYHLRPAQRGSKAANSRAGGPVMEGFGGNVTPVSHLHPSRPLPPWERAADTATENLEDKVGPGKHIGCVKLTPAPS
jgi:hypothetical protein